MPIVPRMLPEVKKLLEPDGEIRFGFLAQRGINPTNPILMAHAINSFVIVVATDNALICISCYRPIGIPRKVHYRLPRTVVMGPLNRDASWSKINLTEPDRFPQRSAWVRRNQYADVEAADRVAIQLGAKDPYPKADG